MAAGYVAIRNHYAPRASALSLSYGEWRIDDLGFEVAVQGLFARPLTKTRVVTLCGLLGVVLVLGGLPGPAYPKAAPRGWGGGRVWATLLILLVCKGWAILLIAQAWLARVTRGHARACAVQIHLGRQMSGEAERANDPEPDNADPSRRPPGCDR